MKKKAFMINIENIKQAIVIQVIFILEINLEKEHFFSKIWLFFCDSIFNFESWLGRESSYVCHYLRNEEKAFTINSQNKNQANGVQIDLHLVNSALKVHVLSKYDNFSVTFASILSPCWDGNVHTYATT